MTDQTQPGALVQSLKQAGPVISVGITAANLLHLEKDLSALKQAEVQLWHVDVMDGHFAGPITVGPRFVSSLPDGAIKDVHLMVDDPRGTVDQFIDAGADIITAHLESTPHIHQVFEAMRDAGVVRGVALNPGAPLAAVEPLLDEIDLILVLGVNPAGGKEFIPSTWQRIRQAQAMIARADHDILLAVDGGITMDNAGRVAAAGADIVVAGSAIFKTGNVESSARTMQERVRSAART